MNKIGGEILRRFPYPLPREIKTILGKPKGEPSKESLPDLLKKALSLSRGTPLFETCCLLHLMVEPHSTYLSHPEKDLLQEWITSLLVPDKEIFPQDYTIIHSQFCKEYPETQTTPELFLLALLAHGFCPIDRKGHFRMRCARPLTSFQKHVLGRNGNVLLLHPEKHLLENKNYREQKEVYREFLERSSELPFEPLPLSDLYTLYPENPERNWEGRWREKEIVPLSDFSYQKVKYRWYICANKYKLFLEMGLGDVCELETRK